MNVVGILQSSMKMMILIKWLLLLSTFPTTSALQKLWEARKSVTAERTMKAILESCHGDNRSSDSIIFGDFGQVIDGSSIIWMNNLLSIDANYEKHQLSNVGASKIVFVEDSPKELQSDLILFKKTRWWNHMASFFIISKNNEKCENFKEILMITWKMDIINSIILCAQSQNTSALYTLNPIANYAPYPWKRMEELNDLNIFHQVFDSNMTCTDLNYDKTKFLDGYEIKSMLRAENEIYEWLPGNVFVPDLYGPEVELLFDLIGTLNASCLLEPGIHTSSMIQRLGNNSLDMPIWMFGFEEYPKKPFVNTFTSNLVLAIVKLNPEVPTLYKIIHLWSPPVLISAAIALTILSLIIIIKHHGVILGLLDIIKLLTYVSIRLHSRSNSFRIYFTTMLIFMIISNGVFQGKIASFLTKPERFPTVETVTELIELGYKLYTHDFSEGTMESQCLECKMTEVSIGDCIKYAASSNSAACIICEYYYQIFWSNLSVESVRKPVSRIFWKFMSRNNWPLHDRVEDALLRIFETGLSNNWRRTERSLAIEKRQANDMEWASSKYRPVKLVRLDFAFKLLAIGLSFATCVFFLELLVAKYKIPRRKWFPVSLNGTNSMVFRAKRSIVWFVNRWRPSRKRLFKPATKHGKGKRCRNKRQKRKSWPKWSKILTFLRR